MKTIIIAILFLTGCTIFISCKKDSPASAGIVTPLPPPPANRPPVANVGIDQTITLPSNSVILNGSASVDPDNNITSYAWTKISGPSSFNIANANAVQTQVSNLVQGNYKFELKVTDTAGLFSKDTVVIMVEAPLASCNMELTAFGNLSIARRNVVTATAGNKILFAGGNLNLPSTGPIIGSARVDIYDVVSKSWSTADLSQARTEIAVAVAGTKIFFAGGFNNFGEESTRVDIYDVSTNIWSTAELSLARESIAATVVGNKIYFAGGWEFYDVYDRIDIYDLSTNTWSTDKLPQANSNLSAVTAGNKIFYAPGWLPSNQIQIYDVSLNSWSAITMSESKSRVSSIAADNKIFWAGGLKGNVFSDNVQIYDINTGISTYHQLSQAREFFYAVNAVINHNKILFYTGSYPYSNKVDVYDLNTKAWSDYNICSSVTNSSIISAGNKVYVAGGYVNGVLSNQVWLLDF
jgi:hypothetical protein